MNMDNSTKIRVLKEFRPYLRLFKAYNCDNFRYREGRFIRRGVFDAFCTSFIITLLSSHIIFDIWYIVDHHTELKIVATLFPLSMTSLQKILSLIAMLVKNGTITELMDQLQRVVDHRKLFIFSFFCPVHRVSTKLKLHPENSLLLRKSGCSINEQSHQLYKRLERKHVFCHISIFKLSFGAELLLFGTTALQPLLFAIVGYPPQQQWILPLETQ